MVDKKLMPGFVLGRQGRFLIMLIILISKILIRIAIPYKGTDKPDKK